MTQRDDDSEDPDERREFLERLSASDRCPVPGPCGLAPCALCARNDPHHCVLGRLLLEAIPVEEAVALSIDALLHAEPGRRPITLRTAARRLLGGLCLKHQRVAESVVRGYLRRETPPQSGAENGA